MCICCLKSAVFEDILRSVILQFGEQPYYYFNSFQHIISVDCKYFFRCQCYNSCCKWDTVAQITTNALLKIQAKWCKAFKISIISCNWRYTYVTPSWAILEKCSIFNCWSWNCTFMKNCLHYIGFCGVLTKFYETYFSRKIFFNCFWNWKMLFKNRPSNICGRQPLKNLTGI